MSGEGDRAHDPPGLDDPIIDPEHLQAIYRQARAEFPSECCGYIQAAVRSEDAELPAALVPCTNRMDRLHALDPETYPRTSANGYDIGGKDLMTLVRSFEGSQPATIVYHSHPRVGAYFSDEDTRAAIDAQWPVDYLVVDAQPDAIGGAILFRRRGDAYVEIAYFDGTGVRTPTYVGQRRRRDG